MISAAWRTALSNTWDHDTRLYFNPRGIEYPAITDTLTYEKDEGLGGIWCASGGAASYLIDCTQPVIVSCMVQVQANSSYIWRWFTAAANTFALRTNGTGQVYGYYHNGTEYTTTAATVSTAWVKTDLLIASNVMTLWVDNTKYGPVNIGAIAAQLPIFYVNADTAKIRNLRIIKYAATEADVLSMYSGVKNAELFGDFAKRSVIQERCNIKRFFHGYSRDGDNDYNATRASFSLHNHTGVFTDDIFAAFDPTADDYNGTSGQAYLSRRIGFWLEEYLPSAYSLMHCFHGYTMPGAFSRSSSPQEGSEVTVKAIDFTADLGKRSLRKTRTWTGLLIADSTDDANSIFHQIAFQGTKKEIYNYLCNSSYENTTIGNSWSVSGGTLTRTAGGLLGSYYGALATNSAFCYQYCTIPVSSGERFTFQILASGDATIRLVLGEYTGAVANDSTVYEPSVVSADGWKLLSVTHDVTDSTSDRLGVAVRILTGTAVSIDATMLSYGDVKYWYINNTNDGTSGVCSYTQAMSGTYDIIGVSADTVNYEHPYCVAEAGEKVWDLLSQVADASMAKYMRISNESVLELASNFTGAATTDNGSIGDVMALSAGSNYKTANKLKVQGVKITTKPNIECVWDARASGLEKDAAIKSSGFGKTVADGDYFPDVADSPTGYEALYSENNSGRKN